jgi:Fur family peroxide stress response transcriptional regulator
MDRKDHPTADTVYMHVRQQYPNISLGTVYRNLTLLSDLGEISRLNVGDGVDRFDADTTPHQHIVCTHCGCVQDVYLPETEKILEYASNFYDGVITTQTIHFRGICKDCLTVSSNN